LDEAGADLFHREALELVRCRGTLEARKGAAPELLGALRGDVDEQEAARDRRRGLNRLDAGRSVLYFSVLRHGQYDSVPESAVQFHPEP
jgi:hypothetical protein